MTSCKCITYEPKPIEWTDRSTNYSTHEIVLSPLEWGHFKITGMIPEPGKCDQRECNVAITINVRIPIIGRTIKEEIGRSKLEFKP